jgi:hypothetical protein
VALRPQPPVPQLPQFFEPPVAPEPLRGLWTGALAAALLILAAVGRVFKEIAARWRGIVLAHIFFLTLWLAMQVFFFVTGAYWCLPSENSKFVAWFSKYYPQIARCGPAASSRGAALPANSLAESSIGSPKAAPSSSASSGGSSAASSSHSPSPSSPPSSTAPFSGLTSGGSSAWSSKSVANCWRDRSVGSGSCYGRGEARRKSPAARSRYPAYPCRRPSECGWDAI